MKTEALKNEICEKQMETFLALDKYERLPPRLTLHLLRCKKCRTQVHYLTLAERYASEPVRTTFRKYAFNNMQIKPVSMTKWIVAGILMILMLVTFGIFLNKIDRTSFAIIFNVMFGVLITVYCALFVSTNIDFFVKKIDKMQTV